MNQKREKNATPNEHCAQTIPVTGWNSFRSSGDYIYETKMSDGGRGRALIGVKVWKLSQKWSVQRSALRSIAS